MKQSSRFWPVLIATISGGMGVLSGVAQAADDVALEEIIVTGSRVMRADQASAMPLRFVSTEDLMKSGSPNLLDIVRALPEASGSIGNTNSSQPGKGQGFEASESINLRGLGPDRNLVLMNGHRLPLVSGYFVNTRNVPMAAIERIEILKEGASAIYGSDAMTGVVNFITKKNFEGINVGGDYTNIKDTNGDYRVDATWGSNLGEGNLLLSAAYQHRSTLWVRDRPWSTPPYTVNPAAGWNFSGNPGPFQPVGPVGPNGVLAPTGALTMDVGCDRLGGIQPFAGFCVNNVQLWQALVNPADTFQLFAQYDGALNDDVDMHLEANYAYVDALTYYPPSFNYPKPITQTVLPSNIDTSTALAGTSPRLYNNWFVPIQNPGLAAYAAANPSQFPAGTTGIFIPVGRWRPYLVGGNPFFGSDPSASAYQTRNQREFRLSGSLKGKFDNGINWNADLTFGRNQHHLKGFDSTGVQIELALRGLGGPNCQWQTAAPGSPGCLWLNPMSNAIQSAPINGVATNPGYVAAVANTKELADWLMVEQRRFLVGKIAEANFGFDGDLSGIDLGGGNPRWAVGGQWRQISFRETDSKFADRTQVPCLDSPLNIPNANVCTPTPYTPLGLAVALVPTDITTDVFAGYAELMLPFADKSNLTLGARYEDYGSSGGGTFNPQGRAKVQLTDWLAFRGSASTTFRAPPQTSLAPNPVASIPGILGRPTALDTQGNPNLQPEKAFTYGFGAVVEAGNFDAAVDYYHYDIKHILTTEPQNAIVNAVFPNGAAGANNCATVGAQFLADHFVFNGACSAANIAKVILLRINGPDAVLSGLDFRASYRFDDVFGGALTLGGSANRALKYSFDPFAVAGLAIAGFDAVGRLNQGTLAYTLPKWKGQGNIDYEKGPVNVRWSMRYNASYIDQRQATTAVGYKIGSRLLHDFTASVDLPSDTLLTASVYNIFDKQPPLVLIAEGYDAMTSDPLERYFRIGLRKSF